MGKQDTIDFLVIAEAEKVMEGLKDYGCIRDYLIMSKVCQKAELFEERSAFKKLKKLSALYKHMLYDPDEVIWNKRNPKKWNTIHYKK